MTKNKRYRVSGFTLLLVGVFLIVMAFASPNPWAKLGPMGLMSVVGGVGFLFLPAKK